MSRAWKRISYEGLRKVATGLCNWVAVEVVEVLT